MKYFQPELECMSRNELNALQLSRLQEQVRYLYDNVLPYRRKMEAVGVTPEDIKQLENINILPFTEKTDLRDNYPLRG